MDDAIPTVEYIRDVPHHFVLQPLRRPVSSWRQVRRDDDSVQVDERAERMSLLAQRFLGKHIQTTACNGALVQHLERRTLVDAGAARIAAWRYGARLITGTV